MHRPRFIVGCTVAIATGTLPSRPEAAFDVELLKAAFNASASDPIRITYETNDAPHTATIAYHGRLRYARLERIGGRVHRLIAVFALRGSASNAKP